jgi:hypothetical protein
LRFWWRYLLLSIILGKLACRFLWGHLSRDFITDCIGFTLSKGWRCRKWLRQILCSSAGLVFRGHKAQIIGRSPGNVKRNTMLFLRSCRSCWLRFSWLFSKNRPCWLGQSYSSRNIWRIGSEFYPQADLSWFSAKLWTLALFRNLLSSDSFQINFIHNEFKFQLLEKKSQNL